MLERLLYGHFFLLLSRPRPELPRKVQRAVGHGPGSYQLRNSLSALPLLGAATLLCDNFGDRANEQGVRRNKVFRYSELGRKRLSYPPAV